MRIGTLGAGMMTDPLAGQWARAGNEIMIGGWSPEKAKALAGGIGARAGTLAEAAGFGDVVLLAVRRQARPSRSSRSARRQAPWPARR